MTHNHLQLVTTMFAALVPAAAASRDVLAGGASGSGALFATALPTGNFFRAGRFDIQAYLEHYLIMQPVRMFPVRTFVNVFGSSRFPGFLRPSRPYGFGIYLRILLM